MHQGNKDLKIGLRRSGYPHNCNPEVVVGQKKEAAMGPLYISKDLLFVKSPLYFIELSHRVMQE